MNRTTSSTATVSTLIDDLILENGGHASSDRDAVEHMEPPKTEAQEMDDKINLLLAKVDVLLNNAAGRETAAFKS